MRITKRTYESIVCYPRDVPPETGGIIGSRKGDGIDTFVGDPGRESSYGCSYVPDTSFLNAKLEEWLLEGILFAGMVHVHFHGVRTLSEGDKVYIKRILESMPRELQTLYFPLIVLPKRELVPYRAFLQDGELSVEEDMLEIV